MKEGDKQLRIYIAGPLFSDAERSYNECLNNFFKEIGFETFLPQHNGYKLSDLLVKDLSKRDAINLIFEKDIEEIQKSDILVLIVDGRVPDEGACVEAGYAYSLGKECIGLKTDCRTLMSDLDNPLIVGVLKNRIARSFKELEKFLLEIKANYKIPNELKTFN
ncbi:MAG: nucleoside 2-deoxyribosyltransferase [Candidatus Altiarchaeales archaeon HGW-Altiarchaeales-1]|nr:MAG: nucleoside 2-deoxyribosyltransferase [Candidatus Altiarchaeales archaeon HGW-Altiarchaeales-2]PKP59730.1 MAG: nucleoside 2-deoxyribosyltransferase [Candidatus Altiarchaeales archaeon HGW-Altiarchaeales-1]